MKALPKTSSPIISLGVVTLVIVGAFKITSGINDRLKSINIEAIPQRVASVSDVNTESFYPVVVKQRQHVANSGVSGSFDEVFKDRVAAKLKAQQEVASKSEAPKVNLGDMLRNAVRVDATTPQGAFINGYFRVVGEELPELTMTNGEKSITPKLINVRAGMVTLAFGTNGRIDVRTQD